MALLRLTKTLVTAGGRAIQQCDWLHLACHCAPGAAVVLDAPSVWLAGRACKAASSGRLRYAIGCAVPGPAVHSHGIRYENDRPGKQGARAQACLAVSGTGPMPYAASSWGITSSAKVVRSSRLVAAKCPGGGSAG